MTGFGDFIDIEPRWRDETRYGSLLSPRLFETVRHRLHPECWRLLSEQMERSAGERARIASDGLCELVREERSRDVYGEITGDDAFWHPDPDRVSLAGFVLESEECGTRLSLPAATTNCGSLRASLRGHMSENLPLKALGRDLEGRLAAAGFERSVLPANPRGPLMVGHGCVTWSDGEVRIWTDPFLRPKRLRYPAGQQPISPLDTAEPIHVVLITHSHPDHFSPASLLLFPEETTIIVPRVERESILSLDLELRARQLGFEDVRALAWGEGVSIGRFAITALPFFGEQPLGAHAVAETADRNQGSTYHVRGPGGLSAMFLADAGSDPAGSTLRIAREVRRDFGPVELLFGNHRRWRVYPPQYITTSVPQYLCHVPDFELGTPQATMLTPDELQAIAAVLSARQLIPYAMGNAPWFAEIGLGPEAVGSNHLSAFDAHLDEMLAAEDPDTLVEPAERIAPLRPGDGVDAAGVWRETNLTPIDPAAFSAPPPSARRRGRAMAIGGVWDHRAAADLLTLTQIDPSAYLVAAPGFVEIVTDGSEDPEFLSQLAIRLLRDYDWISWHPVPLVSGLFGQSHAWLDLFESSHRNASRAIRGGDPDLTGLAELVDSLRRGVKAEAIQAVARDLLAVSVPLVQDGLAAVTAFPAGLQHLPEAATPLIEIHGRDHVSRALLIVKLIHNIALTLEAVGHPQAKDEAVLFADLLRRQPETTA